MLFKTHKEHCLTLITNLFTSVLPSAINSSEKQKQKFGLFILDDMVEFLGPAYLGTHYADVAQ